MILREFSDTSVALQYFYKWHMRLKRLTQRITYIYHNSQAYKLPWESRKKINIGFKYSFLGSITEIEQTSLIVLDDSRVVQYLVNFYKRGKNKVTHYSGASLTVASAKDTKEEMYSSPVRITSILLITTIAINVIFSVVLQKQITLWGWSLRGLILLVAVSGLFCQADWSSVKESCIFLRKMQR